MTLSSEQARDVLRLMATTWGTISDERANGYMTWLTTGCRADFRQVKAAIETLREESEFLPKPAAINAALRSAGALGEAVPGYGDPRIVNAMKQVEVEAMQSIARLRGCSWRELIPFRLSEVRGIYQEMARDDLPDRGSWADRLSALEQLAAER